MQAIIPITQERVYIPRICLPAPDDGSFPFKWTHIQFPVSPAFAITINKSQGQTIEHIGVYLPKPVFSHGQLYVAASRATHPNTICFAIPRRQDGTFVTRNVVYYEAL